MVFVAVEALGEVAAATPSAYYKHGRGYLVYIGEIKPTMVVTALEDQGLANALTIISTYQLLYPSSPPTSCCIRTKH